MPSLFQSPLRAGVTPARTGFTLLAACLLLLAAVFALLSPQASQAKEGRPLIIEAPIKGTIDPVTKEFVESVMKRAREDNASAIVFTMDTPGGLASSMDDIIKEMLNEDDIPVIVFVAPRGAKAASAGAFILMASDIAAMSPSTNVGSATPIQGNGQDISKDLRKKVINDAVAKIRELAHDHDRDEDFAEAAVRDAQNIGAAEAKRRGVIEFVATDLADLLEQIDGTRTVPKGLRVDTANAQVKHLEEPVSLRLLKLFIDPNILFLLFSAGMLGLAFEITHPGVFFPGVVGAICLIIALFGFQVLPINVAGLVLLVMAFVLFAMEATLVSHGVLGTGGAVSLFVGGLLLFDRDSPYSISIWLLALVSLLFAAFFGFIVRKALQARQAKVVTGRETLVGSRGVVRRALEPAGTVFVQGELWQASSADGADIPTGATVEVVAVDGLHLQVTPTNGET